MPGPVPGIHVFLESSPRGKMAGSSPAMTSNQIRFMLTETFGPFLMVW